MFDVFAWGFGGVVGGFERVCECADGGWCVVVGDVESVGSGGFLEGAACGGDGDAVAAHGFG